MPQGIRYPAADALQQQLNQTKDQGGIMRTIMDLLGITDLTQLPIPPVAGVVPIKSSPKFLNRVRSRAAMRPDQVIDEDHYTEEQWAAFEQKIMDAIQAVKNGPELPPTPPSPLIRRVK